MNKFSSFKNISKIVLGAAVVVAVGLTLVTKQTSAFYDASVVNGSINGISINAENLSENFSSNATYSAGYRISSPTKQTTSFQILTQTYRCAAPKGTVLNGGPYGVCVDNVVNNYQTISLNSGNNFAQDVTLSVTQEGNKPCGSLQTDIFFPEGNGWKYIMGSLHYSDKSLNDCNISTPTPTPTATPSVTPTPTPTPSATPTPTPHVTPTPKPLNVVQCQLGQIAKIVNSTVQCQGQIQDQTQHQEQSNNQAQNNNNNSTNNNNNTNNQSQNVNVTVNNPTATPTPTPTPSASVVTVQVAGVSVVNQAPVAIKELPKTGLPLAAVAVSSLLPFGSRLRKLGKKDTEETANSVWMKKQLS